MPSLTRKNRSRRQRHHSRGTRSTNINRSASQNVIGEGAFGFVSRPPAKCGPTTSRRDMRIYYDDFRNNRAYVSKLTEQLKAEEEYEIGQRISRIPDYNKYFIVVEFICPAPESRVITRGIEDLDTYAMMKYGGQSIESILQGKSQYVFSSMDWIKLIEDVKNVVRGIQLLHREHIYHQDIHLGNVVYEPERGARLIDFGQTEYVERGSSRHEYYDLDMLINRFLVPLITYVLESRMFGTRRTRRFYLSANRFLETARATSIRNEEAYDENIETLKQPIRQFLRIYTE